MIPSRNRSQLMLRQDVVSAVQEGRFHVWAVETVEQGLEVLTGQPAGSRDATGAYDPGGLFGKVDARLRELAEGVTRFGPADASLTG